ncbi:ABC transporter ATP-binding protein [Streptomyces sp. bgisy091]|uniref:ABC transporter ATP-binding protein n=1 Tax=Streptomyces sp. bgisy091 TaxID=3413778 RepID=UPI003D75DDCF
MIGIEAHELVKDYGPTRVVDRLTFSVRPGRVTGFLGPNGAGKSTTMRLLLGLDRPTSGTATFGGRPYASLDNPLKHVGSLLDARAAHGSRTARSHLLALATSNGIATRRVETVLADTGLSSVGGRRIRSFSLGMRQRLGIAAAMLGEPEVVLLDEPSNGMDAEGIIWIRRLMRSMAAEGRTVLVSSHLMHEVSSFADHLIVLARGRLLADLPTDEFLATRGRPAVRIRTTEAARTRLHELLARRGHTPVREADESWLVEGVRAEDLSPEIASESIPILELTPVQPSLEQAYLDLTMSETEFASPHSCRGRRDG